MTTASIPKIPRQRLILSSELSSKALNNYGLKSAGTKSRSRQPVQIKFPLTKADPNRWESHLRKIIRANRGPGWGVESRSDRIKITYREPETAKRSAAILELLRA